MSIKEAIKFEQNLYNLINSSGLPVSTAFYILKSVYLDFEKTLYECAKNETNNPVTQEEISYNLKEKEVPQELHETKIISSNEEK